MGLVDRRPVVCPNLAMGFWVPLQYSHTYLDAKYVKKCTSWRTLKINNPLGLLSWEPLASSFAYGGQNLIHSAYEAR